MEDSDAKPTNYVGLIAFVIALACFVLFGHIRKENLGYNVGFCLAIVIAVVMICWDLRFKVWFWTIIIVLLALHIPLMVKVQWPQGWVPWVVLFPIGLADGLIYLGVIKLMEKIIGNDQTPMEVPKSSGGLLRNRALVQIWWIGLGFERIRKRWRSRSGQSLSRSSGRSTNGFPPSVSCP